MPGGIARAMIPCVRNTEGIVPSLQLTDFLDVQTLQAIQDQFAALTGVRTSIRNAAGEPVTRPSPLVDGMPTPPADSSTYFAAGPIELDGQRLGAIIMETGPAAAIAPEQLAELARRFDLPLHKLEQLAGQFRNRIEERSAAAINFLGLLANAIARLCYQEYQLRRRVEELTTIYRVANELVVGADLQKLLDLISKTVVNVMKVKAASLRLLDSERRQLVLKSVFGLSPQYLNKGPVTVEASRIDRAALNGETVFIPDLAHDARVLYPQEMEAEGLVSGLIIGMVYRDRPVGVIHLYTGQAHEFSAFEVSMVRAICNQAAAAIVNTELQIAYRQAEHVQRQLEVARDVQQRMIPAHPPTVPGLDLAGLYTPCFQLGGDFYDFIELGDGRLGLAIADVVGKGVAASLMMASVRSSLRAYAFQHRDIRELIRQVNAALYRDTLPSEFVTLFYGELELASLTLRYCNAGHNPPILLRAGAGGGQGQPGTFEELAAGGTIVGAFADSTYDVGEVRLGPGNLLLLYTDGLTDSMNFREDRYEVERVRQAMVKFADQPAGQVLGNIRWDVRKFTGLTPRVDDLTMVAVKVTGT